MARAFGFGFGFGMSGVSRSVQSLEAFLVSLSGTWWDLTQNTTIVEASIPDVKNTDALNKWVGLSCTLVVDGDFLIVSENTGANAYHRAYRAPTNLMAGPVSAAIVAQGRPGRMAISVLVGGSVTFGLTGEGAILATSAATGFISHLGDGLYLCAAHTTSGGSDNMQLRTALSDGTPYYSGDGREAFAVRAPTSNELALANAGLQGILTQRRAQQVGTRTPGALVLAQATLANQPFLWNGTAWIQDRGPLFNTASGLRITTAIAQPYTRIFVADVETWSTTNSLGDGLGAGAEGLVRLDNSHNYEVYAGSVADSGIVSAGGKEIVVAQFNGAASFVRVNGVQSAALNPGAQNLAGLTTGNNRALVAGLLGYLSDDMIFPSALSAENIQAIESRLAAERGIAL